MFAAQHGIGENICVFCLTEPNNSDVRNYYICFPFGEIVCANAARMKKNGVTTATILSGYISVSPLKKNAIAEHMVTHCQSCDSSFAY